MDENLNQNIENFEIKNKGSMRIYLKRILKMFLISIASLVIWFLLFAFAFNPNGLAWIGFVILGILLLAIFISFAAVFLLWGIEYFKYQWQAKKQSKIMLIIGIAFFVFLFIFGSLGGIYRLSNSFFKTLSEQESKRDNNQQTQIAQDDLVSYFEIKEVGLKFKITDDIKDLVYVATGSGQDEPDFQYIRFSTESLSGAGKYCVPAEAPLGTLVIKHSAPADDSNYYNRTPLLQDANNYVYFDTPQAPCSDIKSIQELQNKQLKDLGEAVRSIEKANLVKDQLIPLSENELIKVASNYYCGKDKSKPVVKNENGTYVFDCTSEFTASDGVIVKNYQTDTVKKILKGDFDGDKREDAVVISHTCGATCYDTGKVILNKEAGIVTIEGGEYLFAKGLDVSILSTNFGNDFISADFLNLATQVEKTIILEIEGDKLVQITD